MIDFENLAVAMGELDEDTVKEILAAVDSADAANAAMEAITGTAAFFFLAAGRLELLLTGFLFEFTLFEAGFLVAEELLLLVLAGKLF